MEIKDIIWIPWIILTAIYRIVKDMVKDLKH
jgi:hypothetical protein